ncbi:hypothetical protein Tco_0053007 [Tanacetum coccineum]
MTMDPFTKNVLRDFWKKNDNHEGVINNGFYDLEEANNHDEQEIGEIFITETNLFNYETPLYTKFNEYNYLLKIDLELFTYDVERTETYTDYMNKFNDELEKPWSEDGVPYEISDHICEPFQFKNGEAKWPTCSSNEDGFCNDINRIFGMNGEASYNNDVHNENEHEDDERYDYTTQERPICQIIKYMMIKYSFWDDEKYVAIKEDEYDDLTSTSEEACRAYQEIFCNIYEGWMVTRDE